MGTIQYNTYLFTGKQNDNRTTLCTMKQIIEEGPGVQTTPRTGGNNDGNNTPMLQSTRVVG